jgi:hypothetical protein
MAMLDWESWLIMMIAMLNVNRSFLLSSDLQADLLPQGVGS